MQITRWKDANGNLRITVKYGSTALTFTNEIDANRYRLRLEREVLNIEDF